MIEPFDVIFSSTRLLIGSFLPFLFFSTWLFVFATIVVQCKHVHLNAISWVKFLPEGRGCDEGCRHLPKMWILGLQANGCKACSRDSCNHLIK